MGAVASAVAWMLATASDDSHGYDQANRWGPNYDCSSMVITAYEQAGIPVKTNGATYTGNMVSVFKKTGFKDVTAQINLSTGEGLIPGDVVWRKGHTEMCSRTGYLVGAHGNELGTITGGQSGDQTGREVSEGKYYNSPWTTVLRYPEGNDTVDKSEVTSSNAYLSQAKMQINARYIYQYFSSQGWTLNAIAGMLGNMQRESTINPGLWQSMDEGNTSMGLGLVQWTPATKLINFASANGYASYTDIDCQLAKIMDEFTNGGQYYQTGDFPLSFYEFSRSTESPEYLASAFLHNYERAGVEAETERQENARYWYNYLSSYEPDAPEPDEPNVQSKRKGMSLMLMYVATKR